MLIQFAPILIIGLFLSSDLHAMRKKPEETGCDDRSAQERDRALPSSGIYGVVAGVKERTFILKIADQVKIEISKNAVTGLQSPEESQGN